MMDDEAGGGGGLVLGGGAEEDDALLAALRSKAAQAKQQRRTRADVGGGNKEEEEAGGSEGGSSPARREVRQPREIFDVPTEDDYTKPLWIQLNTHDLLSFYQLMHHAVHKECTPVSCPKMSAGPNFEFLWSEGDDSAKPATMSASEYIAALVQWAHKLTNGFQLDPEDEVAFKKTYRLIWSRSFRIAMHLYWHHWPELTALKLDALLNAFTKHFVIFALKFRLLASWDSVSAIYDLLSSILPPLYATQLKDLRDGKKRARGGPARRPKEARVIPVGRRRAYSEWDVPEPSLLGASPPPISSVIPTAEPVSLEPKAEETREGAERNNEDKTKTKEKNEEERKQDSSAEHAGGGREEKGGSKKSGSKAKKEESKGSSVKSGGSSQHKKGEAVRETKAEASPLKAGHTLAGEQGRADIASGPASIDVSSGDGGSGSGRGSRSGSPRLTVDDDRRQRGSRIQMSKEDFIRELQRQKEAKLQSDGLSPVGSPRGSPLSPKSASGIERKHSAGDDNSAVDSGRAGKGSSIELPEPVRRFFTPPGSPRPETASPPSSPKTAPTSPMSSQQADTGSPSAVRRFTVNHTAAAGSPPSQRYPTIPPSFDLAKAMADLAALDQEYADFEELHSLELRLLSARSDTTAASGGKGNSLTALFGVSPTSPRSKSEKAGSGDDEEEGIYSLLSPRKYAKRQSIINQKEYDELRLQLIDQEKKRSRTWVTKRTSLPRNMQELKGSYIRDPLPAPPSLPDSNSRPSS